NPASVIFNFIRYGLNLSRWQEHLHGAADWRPRSYLMNRASSVSPPSPPPSTQEQATRPGSASSLIAWLGRVLPAMLLLVALGGVAYFGPRTGWTLPRFSALIGKAPEEKDDWCDAHAVPESECVECNPTLLPRDDEFTWCNLHGIPVCPLDHPEAAQ